MFAKEQQQQQQQQSNNRYNTVASQQQPHASQTELQQPSVAQLYNRYTATTAQPQQHPHTSQTELQQPSAAQLYNQNTTGAIPVQYQQQRPPPAYATVAVNSSAVPADAEATRGTL